MRERGKHGEVGRKGRGARIKSGYKDQKKKSHLAHVRTWKGKYREDVLHPLTSGPKPGPEGLQQQSPEGVAMRALPAGLG